MEEKQRTIQQNKALHKYFELIAEELNSAGYDMKKVLKPGVEIPWSRETVKEYLWRPLQEAYLLKPSTTKLNTKEIDKIIDILTKHLGEKLGIELPDFPSIESIINSQRDDNNISTHIFKG